MLSVIVKRVTGRTLSEFVRQNIFLPLGMTHTVYRTDYAMLIPKRAMGYAPIARGRFKNSMSNWEQTGDGAVQLSVRDAAKWDENFYRPRVGGRRMISELQTAGRLANGKRLHYARGLFIGTYRGVAEISHDGSWIGYRAAFDRFPTLHTSVVVLCNSDAAEPSALAQGVEDVVLAPHLARVRSQHVAGPMKRTALARELAGWYLDEAGAEVLHVVAKGNALALQAGGNTYPLTPTGELTFRLGSTPVRFTPNRANPTTMQLGTGDDATIARRFTPVTPTPAQLVGVSGDYYSSELDVTWHLRASAHSVGLERSRFVPAEAAGALEPQVPDLFTSDAGGFMVRLIRNSQGAVTGFTLSAGRGLRALKFTRTSGK